MVFWVRLLLTARNQTGNVYAEAEDPVQLASDSANTLMYQQQWLQWGGRCRNWSPFCSFPEETMKRWRCCQQVHWWRCQSRAARFVLGKPVCLSIPLPSRRALWLGVAGLDRGWCSQLAICLFWTVWSHGSLHQNNSKLQSSTCDSPGTITARPAFHLVELFTCHYHPEVNNVTAGLGGGDSIRR